MSQTELGGSPGEGGGVEDSEYSESEVGDMSGHGGSRALDRLGGRA